jgi:citrate lyase subunit beta / citryl-CoA lyase
MDRTVEAHAHPGCDHVPVRLRRSILSVPGSEHAKLAKAAGLAPDIVMLDLEDAVSPSRKDEARAQVVAALAELDWRAPSVAVRINAVGSRWCLDDVLALLELAAPLPDLLVVPKVESVAHVHFLDELLSALERRSGRSVTVGLDLQIETVRGVDQVEAIASASRRIEALTFGPGDYGATIGVSQLSIGAIDRTYPGDQWHYVLSRIVVAAKARGLAAVDGPFAAIRDLDGLRESAFRARAVGCDGKWALHPDQIAVVNEVFSPEPAEVERAQAIVAALAGAAGDGRGVLAHGDEMIDEATRKTAEDVLARARAAGLVA